MLFAYVDVEREVVENDLTMSQYEENQRKRQRKQNKMRMWWLKAWEDRRPIHCPYDSVMVEIASGFQTAIRTLWEWVPICFRRCYPIFHI